MLKKKSYKRPAKRKAMMVTWYDEYIPSEEEQDGEDEENSNYFFMAKYQGEKVTNYDTINSMFMISCKSH